MSNQHFDNKKLRQYASLLRSRYIINNKVLLIQAPQFLFKSFNVDVAKNRGYYAYPPTGLQCIVKALSERNLEIEILDLNYSVLKHIAYGNSFDGK